MIISLNPYTPRVLFMGHQQNAASDQVLHCLLAEVSF